MWGAWGALYGRQDGPFCPEHAHRVRTPAPVSAQTHPGSKAPRRRPGGRVRTPAPSSISTGRVRVPDVFSERGTRAHTTVRSSLGAVQLGTRLRRRRCFTLREETARGLRLPLGSQNRRGQSFGEKGHALVLDLVLEREAPAPLGGRRRRPPQDPQLRTGESERPRPAPVTPCPPSPSLPSPPTPPHDLLAPPCPRASDHWHMCHAGLGPTPQPGCSVASGESRSLHDDSDTCSPRREQSPGNLRAVSVGPSSCFPTRPAPAAALTTTRSTQAREAPLLWVTSRLRVLSLQGQAPGPAGPRAPAAGTRSARPCCFRPHTGLSVPLGESGRGKSAWGGAG